MNEKTPLQANWKPYDEVLQFWRPFLSFRWTYLGNPLRRPLKCTALSILPGSSAIIGLTIGEFLVIACSLVAVLSLISGKGGGFGTGGMASYALALSFGTASHNSIFSWALGLSFERLNFWHVYVAFFTLALSIWHGLQHHILFLNYSQEHVSGVLMFSFIMIGMLSASEPIRKYFHKIFHFMHVAAALGIIFAAVAHGSLNGISLGLLMWLIDGAYRVLYQARLKNPREATIEVVPGSADVVHMVIDVGQQFKFYSGQYIVLCVPIIGLFDWHPFSISSAYHEMLKDGKMHLYVRARGPWTTRLLKLAQSKTSPVRVTFEGPLGNNNLDLHGETYRQILLIAGGIGITYIRALALQLADERSRGRPLDRLQVLWSVRDQALVDEIGPDLFESAGLGNDIGMNQPLKKRSNSLVNIHLTGLSSLEPQASAGHGEDFVPVESSGTLPGRPDLDAYFGGMIEVELNKLTAMTNPVQIEDSRSQLHSSRVAVVVCGPDELIRETAQLCRDQSSGFFDIHIESFSM